jgi:hypothetical protein
MVVCKSLEVYLVIRSLEDNQEINSLKFHGHIELLPNPAGFSYLKDRQVYDGSTGVPLTYLKTSYASSDMALTTTAYHRIAFSSYKAGDKEINELIFPANSENRIFSQNMMKNKKLNCVIMPDLIDFRDIDDGKTIFDKIGIYDLPLFTTLMTTIEKSIEENVPGVLNCLHGTLISPITAV